MNKKQTAITVLLLSLMFLLAISQGFFVDNFSRVRISENSHQFKEYAFEEYSIEFPEEWTIDEKENKDGYISYNINFKSKDNATSGLVQVINSQKDVRNYAEADLNKQSLEYYNNEIMPFEDSESIGVLSKYNTNIKDGYSYINECYYIKGTNGQIIKVLFNISKNSYSKETEDICLKIASSIKQNK